MKGKRKLPKLELKQNNNNNKSILMDGWRVTKQTKNPMSHGSTLDETAVSNG